MKTYYKAIHSSGAVHLRASASNRVYMFAIVGCSIGDVQFSSKRPPALGLESLQAKYETVQAHAITAKEYAALDRANKNFCSAVFRGKTYTHTDSVQNARAVCAVGVHRPRVEQRIDMKPLDPTDQQSVGQWKRHPEGFWINVHNESSRVHFYSNKDRAIEAYKSSQSHIGRTDWIHNPDVVELLEVVQS